MAMWTSGDIVEISLFSPRSQNYDTRIQLLIEGKSDVQFMLASIDSPYRRLHVLRYEVLITFTHTEMKLVLDMER